MKYGFVRQFDEAGFFEERLKEQGTERVIIGKREELRGLLDNLTAADSINVVNIFHLSRDSEELEKILQELQNKGVSVYIDGKYLDLEDEQTAFEIRQTLSLHNAVIDAMRKDLESFKGWRERHPKTRKNES